jgi:hypothetical protein
MYDHTHRSAVLGCSPPTLVCVLASMCFLGTASASTGVGPKTHIGVLNLQDQVRFACAAVLSLKQYQTCQLAYGDFASDSFLVPGGGSSVTKTRKTPGRDGANSSITLEKDAAGRTVSQRHSVSKDGNVLHQHQEHIGKHGGERRFPDEWTGTSTVNAPPHTPKLPSFPQGSN